MSLNFLLWLTGGAAVAERRRTEEEKRTCIPFFFPLGGGGGKLRNSPAVNVTVPILAVLFSVICQGGNEGVKEKIEYDEGRRERRKGFCS